MQRLADRTKQHVLTTISKNINTIRQKPPRLCKNDNSKINCESAIGQNLITNPECAKTYTDDNFRIIGQARLKTKSCVDKKCSLSHWDSSSKRWLVGPNWPLLGSIGRILSRVTASGYIFRLTFRSLSDVSYSDECWTKNAFKYIKRTLPHFRAVGKTDKRGTNCTIKLRITSFWYLL